MQHRWMHSTRAGTSLPSTEDEEEDFPSRADVDFPSKIEVDSHKLEDPSVEPATSRIEGKTHTSHTLQTAQIALHVSNSAAWNHIYRRS